MYLIAGLGNPTKQYAGTRHNMGFDCVDILAKELNIKFKKSRFNALVGKGKIAGEDVLLVKPLTFMNLSGFAVGGLMKYYKLNAEKDLIVIYDDTDLELGKLRIRKKGSAGGHNGMKSIISNVGTDSFARIRVGIGSRGDAVEMVDFVLGSFTASERRLIDEALSRAAQAAQDIVKNGADHAMNNFN